MKQHTTSFKENIKLLGKQQKVQIIYGENVLNEENINSVNFYYQGDLLKSIMKGLNIDSNINIPKDTELVLKYGLLVNGEYEYLDYGKFIVYDVEKQEDTNSYAITCYDKLLYSMKDYEAMDITYPITIENYLKAICRHIGVEYEEKEIANANRMIYNELYLSDGDSLDYTFRDVLDEISQVTAGSICINKDDKLEVRYINDTGDTIDEEYFKDINVKFGEKYGKINGVVLSRSAGADNVYIVDEQSVKENGLCEIKIVDNQIMNFNDRADYLPEILEKVNGIEYYANDFSSTGIMYYDILDSYNIKIGENTYKCLMLNDEINITQGLEELIYTEMPEVSETDYKKADKTDRRIKQAYIIVDKATQKIEAIVSDLNEAGYGSFSELVQDIQGIKTNVGFIADLTQTKSGINPITLEECLAGELQYLSIKANNTIFNPLYPRPDLYPSPTLYPRGKTYLHIINQKENDDGEIIQTTQVIDLGIKQGIRMLNSEVYDEIVYEAVVEEGKPKCKIIRRVGVMSDGTLYALETPNEEKINIETLGIEAGTNIITFNEGHYGNITATYVKKNEFTSIFATTYEVNSYITQLANEIDLMVKQENIIADFNIAVRDGKGILRLKGNVVEIDSDHCTLSEDGVLTLKNTTTDPYQYTVNDVISTINYTKGTQALSEGLVQLYDYNNDGVVDVFDIVSMINVIEGKTQSTKYANAEIILNPLSPSEFIKMSLNGSVQCKIGLNEIYNYTIRGMHLFLGTFADMNNKYGVSVNGETGEILVTSVNEQTQTAIDANKVDAYYVLSGSQGMKGRCMHGIDESHDYLCHWNGSTLQFYVDSSVIGSLSDERLKTDIEDISENLINAIDNLGFKQFKLKNKNGKISVGIIAQDLIKAFKNNGLKIDDYDFISETQYDLHDKTKYYIVEYEQFLLLHSKLLKNKIDNIENKIEKRDKIIEFLAEKLDCQDEVLKMLEEGE